MAAAAARTIMTVGLHGICPGWRWATPGHGTKAHWHLGQCHGGDFSHTASDSEILRTRARAYCHRPGRRSGVTK